MAERSLEINFRGSHLKFSSWSGSNLTPYDIEYRPWDISFKKENAGYVRHYELKPGDVVVDAGGYEGTFAIYAATVVGKTGRVIVLGYGMIPLFKQANVIMLKDHGVVAIGPNLTEATKLLVESADKDKPYILPLVRPLG